jgi:glycosyltransferase involved in cell wall biosynthesis
MADAKIVCPFMISVVIPYYNAARWISRTLDSCLAQKEFIREIILIDDFSSDSGREIILAYQKEHPDLIIFHQNKVKGGNNARNYGAELATGDFIQWLDADDQILPGKCSSQLAVFEKDRGIDIVYSDWQLDTYDPDGNLILTEHKRHRPYPDFLLELLIDNWSPPHNYLIKVDFVRRLGKINAWNPETQSGQDREYFTLAGLMGAKSAYVSGNYCVYNRWNKASVSATKSETKNRNFEKMLCRFEEVLQHQSWISPGDRKRYQNIINTQKLKIAITGLPVPIRFGKVHLYNIEWPIVKGFRTTAKVIWEVIKA